MLTIFFIISLSKRGKSPEVTKTESLIDWSTKVKSSTYPIPLVLKISILFSCNNFFVFGELELVKAKIFCLIKKSTNNL